MLSWVEGIGPVLDVKEMIPVFDVGKMMSCLGCGRRVLSWVEGISPVWVEGMGPVSSFGQTESRVIASLET